MQHCKQILWQGKVLKCVSRWPGEMLMMPAAAKSYD